MNETPRLPSSVDSNQNTVASPFTGTLYRFEVNRWIKTNDFQPSDVVVVLDELQNRLYYYEGNETSAQDHQSAKTNLIRFQNSYPDLTIIRIESLQSKQKRKIPIEVLTYLNSHQKR